MNSERENIDRLARALVRSLPAEAQLAMQVLARDGRLVPVLESVVARWRLKQFAAEHLADAVRSEVVAAFRRATGLLGASVRGVETTTASVVRDVRRTVTRRPFTAPADAGQLV